MESKIAKKVSRFIELSEKFSKTEGEVFPPNEQLSYTFNAQEWNNCLNSCGTIYLSNNTIDGRGVFVDTDGVVKAKDNKPLSRAEKIKAEAEMKAKISDEFDEYLTLRNDLKQYFNALNKITDEH